jgi:vitamin B12 transporter
MLGQELRSTASPNDARPRARRVAPPALVLMMALLALLHGAGEARADEPGEGDAAPALRTASDVVVPQAVYVAPPAYPRAALARGEEADVVLELVIDPQGRVTHAVVVGSASAEFDEAALEAARRCTFVPAKRSGAPIAAKIRFVYPFRLPKKAAEDAAQEAPLAEPSPKAPAPVKPVPEAPRATEVVVRGLSTRERMQQSAEAVSVVDTERARRETADMGQVVARSPGVVVRRSGGLGSESRFTLNGLSGDQVRYFLDGVPLEQAGYPLGVANVPVNLIERVEIYRGVVPIRFGADALGGAVNLVTRQRVRGTHGFASYEFGSFHTYRLAFGARTHHVPTGIFVRGDGFYDYARNDYLVDVQVTNDDGRLSPRTVRRFHDRYGAAGGSLEVGVVDRSWARRFFVRLFATDFDRDIQHNRSMTRVFGEVTDGQSRKGATLRYLNSWQNGIELEALATYSRGTLEFVDTSHCIYDWYGECQVVRRSSGELDARPYDRRVAERSLLGRLNLSYESDFAGTLRLVVTPSFVAREGEERALPPGARRDPFGGENSLATVVSGLEYELDLASDRLENVVFGKTYFQSQQAIEPLLNGHDAERDNIVRRLGWGDGLRYRFTDEWYGKVSYELSTRLPKPNEVFGDASLIEPNFELLPEVSHNLNLTLAGPKLSTNLGQFRAEVSGYLRDVRDQILLLPDVNTAQYANVADARFLGVEAAGGWTSPGEYLALDVNLTAQDARNTSSDGPFRRFEGDRLPNQPYLFGNGAARFQLRDLVMDRDELSLTWNARYVHDFYLAWESYGDPSTKSVVEAQLLHSLGLTFLIRKGALALSSTIEVQNLTDAKSTDYFGVQKPGRAFFFKSVAEL